ncbi:hypothetical protein [Natronococcus wangiae]|uniref:hypothetical protein n=1 Tax=Natronococcus wangiae TaxID=3068275 RepID=UPI00273D62F7|nr:hypothetical protein [Natronococcus sp. AD5]
MDDEDPSAIRSIAVSPDDAVDAFVYSRENPGEAVLRVTPPFHGRMRARIHVYRVDDTHLTGAVHLSPDDVIEDDVSAAYPRLEDELEDADPDETGGIRKRHAEAVEAWQERAREAIVESVPIETADGSRRVEVKRLG